MANEEELKRELETLRRDKREEDVKWRVDTTAQIQEVITTNRETHAIIKNISEDLINVRKTVYGNNGNDGLMIKVDRHEQRHSNQTWFNRLLIGAGITGAFAVLRDMFGK